MRIAQYLLLSALIATIPPHNRLRRVGFAGNIGRQDDTRADSVEVATGLRVLVDGTKNPELISDQLAYKHLLRALAVGDAAPVSELERQDAILDALTLSEPDRVAVIVIVRKLGNDLGTIRQAYPAGGEPENATELQVRETAAIEGARLAIQGVLTPDGAARFDRFIQRVKTRIVIFGTGE